MWSTLLFPLPVVVRTPRRTCSGRRLRRQGEGRVRAKELLAASAAARPARLPRPRPAARTAVESSRSSLSPPGRHHGPTHFHGLVPRWWTLCPRLTCKDYQTLRPPFSTRSRPGEASMDRHCSHCGLPAGEQLRCRPCNTSMDRRPRRTGLIRPGAPATPIQRIPGPHPIV
jgi:hypothetical protein